MLIHSLSNRRRALSITAQAAAAMLATTSMAWAQSAPTLHVETVSSSPDATVLRVIVPLPKLDSVETPSGVFQRFALNNGGGAINDIREVGLPEVPLTGFSLALPVDAKDGSSTVEIVPEGSIKRQQARLYPVQPPESNRAGVKDDAKFEFDADRWAKGVKTPGQDQGVLPVFKGDASVNGYRLSPYGYNPAEQLITYYPSYLVTIKHPGNCFIYDRLKLKGVVGTRVQGFDGIDQRIEQLPLPALQFTINKDLASKLRCAPPIIINPAIFGARFLIVTHPNFKAAADTLKAHKQALGISTRVVTTADITGGGANATEGQIRSWIANYYNTHLVRPKWVLFMGDAEFVPTHYDQANIWDSARNAGDMWYGQFLPGATATTIPPFGIGRFPVDTLAQANTIVSKVMAFENSPPANPIFGQDFYSRLTFASFFQITDSNGTTPTRDKRWFVETSEMVRDHAVSKGYSVARLYHADAAANPLFYNSGAAIPAALKKPGFAWDADRNDIAAAINQGSSLVYHRDHGWWSGWGDPSFQTGDLGLISVTNNEFPVVFSINCASGIFDNETVDLAANKIGAGYGPGVGSTYWAEAFLRKSDGALAVIGDSRSSSTTDNNHFTLGLFDGVFPGLVPTFGAGSSIQRLGDLLNYAKTYISDVSSGAQGNRHPLNSGGSRPAIVNLRQELNIYNLLGDPTVKLRVSAPWKFGLPFVALEKTLVKIKVPVQPGCLTCPPELASPEWITVVAFDPKTGLELGRGLINGDGVGEIDLGDDFKGDNVMVRVASPDGASTQAAAKETDSDSDTVPDSRDNCVAVPNKEQQDTDGDGYGNACDADLNNDGFVNSLDLSALRGQFGKRGVAGDLNGDGLVNSLDVSRFSKLFGKVPGPSALHLPVASAK
ncbi:MAG: C25 family cysteine peptidase [Aquabacterium sp.]|uniref:C25 family cysteine peptidase n=1 Tax=Aquabacterium sp. TaxID=1872578 RepID=UPI00271E10DF|nr:C25 family cysteine peptidase [Aquabacterium sp.]MDO9006363.1 C25 family cysteine peptidase [Aquabacterium sp.]